MRASSQRALHRPEALRDPGEDVQLLTQAPESELSVLSSFFCSATAVPQYWKEGSDQVPFSHFVYEVYDNNNFQLFESFLAHQAIATPWPCVVLLFGHPDVLPQMTALYQYLIDESEVRLQLTLSNSHRKTRSGTITASIMLPCSRSSIRLSTPSISARASRPAVRLCGCCS